MLIALATFISIVLLGGNMNEVFYVDDIDKLAKEYVIDTDRKDQVNGILSAAKKENKAFVSNRKAELKKFKSNLADTNVSDEALTLLVDSLQTEVIAYNESLVQYRIKVMEQITDEEWGNIIEASNEKTVKRLGKIKPNDKEAFRKTRGFIETGIEDPEVKKSLHDLLNELIVKTMEANEVVMKLNVMESEVLINRNSTKDELMDVLEQMTQLRSNMFRSVIIFRKSVLETCSKKEANGLMKAFNSELVL